MKDNNIVPLKSPTPDTLGELLKRGAQELLAKAIESELAELLSSYNDELIDGKKVVVRNGYQPERSVQTGLGDISVKIPKVRDRSKQGVKFNSKLIPPYLRRTKNLEEFIPWLYLKGISTGDMQPALETLLGEGAKGLSAGTVSRLKQSWENDYDAWRKRDLSKRRYVYIWADGVYCNVRMDDKLCLLVIVGSDDTGRKEVLAVVDGYRESEASWVEVLEQLESQGLSIPPLLATGDGALGFWKAVTKKWPATAKQRCWVHKTANILNKVPKPVQPKIKEALHDIWMAGTRKDAYTAYESCLNKFSAKYEKAMNCLSKDKEQMLAFYDFPAEHWGHIRTSNPIESVFATVRLRTTKVKSCGSRKTTLSMAWKLMTTAESKWRRLKGYKLLADVVQGIKFKDGEVVKDGQLQGTA
ncbi:MAG: IS256 family transposase [Methylococcales bacterium]|jgi:putative transposase|nr:IS256 family transposase [Methylococcales bacterium]